jgi:hypothetical protein
VSVLGGWLLAPLVLVLLCTGIGLALEAAVRARVPGPFLPALGLAGLMVLAGVTTVASWSARLAPWLCLVVALAGFALGRPWRDERLRAAWPWAAAAALAGFALVAGPPVLSGQASIAGYIKLDDSAIWLGLIAHVMEHGRDISMVPKSTFQLDLVNWLGSGYPVGAFTPVGVTAKLSGQDYANVYQPAIGVYTAIAALGLYGCARDLLASRWAACVAAVVGVQASLFYGYAEWGSIKEIAATALLVSLVGLGATGGRRVLWLAGVLAGGMLDVYGIGGLVWALAGFGAAVAVALLRRRAVRDLALDLAGAAVAFAVTAIPEWAVLSTDAHQTSTGAPVAQEDLGKLFAPLKLLQGAGLWPAGDFRILPDPIFPATMLALLGLGLAAVGVGVAVSRRAWVLPALVAATLVSAIAVLAVGAPWIDAKVLAISAPVPLTAAAIALLAARDTEWRFAAAVGGVVIAAGCVASSWLVARDVYVAPRAELVELRGLGDQLAGKGPALVLNYEGYGTRYYLGPAADEGVSELRYNTIPSRTGEQFPNFATAEVDDVDQAALFSYPVIVRRTTPVGSRHPSGYRPVHEGRFFEAWQRDGTPLPANHVSLGTATAPGARLPCAQARASAAGNATLVAAPMVNPVVIGLDQARIPADWRTGADVRPHSDGSAIVAMTVPRAGTWRVWVGGSVLGKLSVQLDGHEVGSVRHLLDASVGWMRFSARQLGAGRHVLTLDYRRGWGAGRGSSDNQLPLGPVALSLEDQPPLVRVPAAHARRLCDGRTYDWVEAFK